MTEIEFLAFCKTLKIYPVSHQSFTQFWHINILCVIDFGAIGNSKENSVEVSWVLVIARDVHFKHQATKS